MIQRPSALGRSAATPAGFPRKRGRLKGRSDGFVNLDAPARFVENCDVAVMTRHYFIVARDQTSLCEYLTRQFAAEENVEVFLDRRSGRDRRTAEAGADTVERRSTDRRHQPFVDTQLRSLGYAMFRVQ